MTSGSAAPATTSSFRLLMLSAMYENGGNVTHRFLDGHPALFVYPFESQLGTRLVVDGLSAMFPVKYRWPEFALHGTSTEDFDAIIDEETRVRARTPDVSKFRHVAFELSDEQRRRTYAAYIAANGRSRGYNVEAFFRATFETWTNRQSSGKEEIYVGYSPIVIVDADKILNDLNAAHLLHVVRNPWSAYADHKKRPVPLSMKQYMLGWVLNQYCAGIFQQQYAGRVHVLRVEDIFDDPRATLGRVCDAMGVGSDAALEFPTWNGKRLDDVAPWGTIRKASTATNCAAARELSERERAEIRLLAGSFLDAFDYASLLR